MTETKNETSNYQILTLKNTIVFPKSIRSLFFNRPESIASIKEAYNQQNQVVMVALQNQDENSALMNNIYDMGVVGYIRQVHQLPNGTVQVRFEGMARARILNTFVTHTGYQASVEVLKSDNYHFPDLPRMIKAVKKELFKFLEADYENFLLDEKLNDENITAGSFADIIASIINLDLPKLQDVLETQDAWNRLEKVYSLLLEQINQKVFEKNFKEQLEKKMGKRQKEYYLNEQMKAIKDELGQNDEPSEVDELASKIEAAKMPQTVKEVAEKELKRLNSMGQQSHEAAPLRNYLDWLVNVPWHQKSEDNLSIKNAKQILDEDHFGLEKVKERIIEYIAVANAVGKLKGPIICLTGPPGVGKTSLASSIARSLGRKFARISLGGVRDEAEVRGHRRTYVGSMPGRIIQTMKKVETLNPLILLDEVDKISQHYMGGPTSAMLEVLDPEQNHTFTDHYLEVEYNLSQVLFICTANNLADIPGPLRDRMEVIELSGYTELEKVQIAKNFLLPKQIKVNGIKKEQMQISEEQLLPVIQSYTREAGVRNLERKLAKICRKTVVEIQQNKTDQLIKLDSDRLRQYLGVPPFQYNQIENRNEVGMVTGLAWTSVGGETLSIEVMTMRGKGKVQLTGKLGDVMKESAQAAISYVHANANHYGIYSKVFDNLDIHIHVPAGGTPKDGPSAGIAITSAIVSSLTGIPIDHEIALTGEVTLRGKVLPIGGLNEKLLAARRAQIKKVLIPDENQKDLEEISEEILSDLEIKPVKHVSEVIPLMLERLPIPVKDEDLDDTVVASTESTKNNFNLPGMNDSEDSPSPLIRH
ncbi:MAG: endopeptidase La [Deltaproteobacteria bacterium]|jgi:ATP-dependent Lon protease|nr:endopeptidase La [Deltaproteobacteria bacterium]